MSDTLRICGIRCSARVGVPDWERRKPQIILIDAELSCDLRKAAKTDDFRNAVDYQRLETLLRKTAEAKPRQLIETLAEDLARSILASDKRIKAAVVRVHKSPAAMPKTREVCVEILRRRR